MRVYNVGYTNPQWKNHPCQHEIKDYTEDEARQRRRELQKLGFIKVFIKLRKGLTTLSDY